MSDSWYDTAQICTDVAAHLKAKSEKGAAPARLLALSSPQVIFDWSPIGSLILKKPESLITAKLWEIPREEED